MIDPAAYEKRVGETGVFNLALGPKFEAVGVIGVTGHVRFQINGVYFTRSVPK
jgi:hypothetical protein